MVYRHINQEGIFHFMTESTSKIMAHIVIYLNLADFANSTTFNKTGECPCYRFIAIILADNTCLSSTS